MGSLKIGVCPLFGVFPSLLTIVTMKIIPLGHTRNSTFFGHEFPSSLESILHSQMSSLFSPSIRIFTPNTFGSCCWLSEGQVLSVYGLFMRKAGSLWSNQLLSTCLSGRLSSRLFAAGINDVSYPNRHALGHPTYAYAYTYMCTYIYTYIYTYTFSYSYTYIYPYTYTNR